MAKARLPVYRNARFMHILHCFRRYQHITKGFRIREVSRILNRDESVVGRSIRILVDDGYLTNHDQEDDKTKYILSRKGIGACGDNFEWLQQHVKKYNPYMDIRAFEDAKE